MATASAAIRTQVAGLVVGRAMPARRKAPKTTGTRWNPERLKAIREAVGLSPERLAELLNQTAGLKVSGRKIRRWESHDNAPSVEELASIARVFHVDISRFFSVDDD